VRRQDEQVSDLPEVGESQRSWDLRRDRKTDEPPTVFSDERAEAVRAQVLLQPGCGSGAIGSLAVVSAVPVEDLGERLDLAACRRCQIPNRDGRSRS
jgi:hypothetical protein